MSIVTNSDPVVRRERICRVEELDDAITAEEVQKALKEMKGGKATEMDGCHAECKKRGDLISMVEWLLMFNVCFVTSVVLKDWVSVCIAPLYKGKDDNREYSNYRGTYD